MYSIQEYKEKLQKWLMDDLTFTIFIVVLVAVAAFGIGRWSILESVATSSERPVLVPTPIAVEQVAAVSENQSISTVPASTPSSATLVASRNGTKYHALDCAGAKQISEANKIYFQTELEARSAGYTPAANCSF